MTIFNFLMIGSYWVFTSGAVFITGALILKILITGPSGADSCIHSSTNRPLGESSITLLFSIAIITLLFNVIHVIVHCSIMTETPLAEVFSILPLFLLKTKYGIFSLTRIILTLLMALTMSLYVFYRNAKWPALTGVFFSILLIATLAISGHQGTKGYLSIPFFLDVIHTAAISIWIGGIFLICCSYADLMKRSEQEINHICLKVANRFSRIATLCVTVIVVSGLVLSFYNVKNWAALITTDYGIVLSIKISLVLLIILLGGLNKLLFIPGMQKTHDTNRSQFTSCSGKLHTTIRIEAILGLIILLTTGILTHLSPGE
jgi:putative copper resistance protein D